MLDANIKQQLQGYLERLTQPIEIVAALDDSDASREMRRAAARMSHRSRAWSRSKEADDGATRTPSFRINRPGTDLGIEFAGLPMGHEFTSLVLALLQVGGHPPRVEAAVHRAGQGAATASSTSRPTSRSAARTAPTWCRHST